MTEPKYLRLKLPCPNCGDVHPETVCVTEEGTGPDNGDMNICFSCRAISVFVKNEWGISLRLPTEPELHEAMTDHRMMLFLAVLEMDMDPRDTLFMCKEMGLM